jgi:ParB-like chromosome segregation protein Spo0J
MITVAFNLLLNRLPEETQLALRSSVTDFGHSLLTGKRSVEEWAEDFVKAIDECKEQIAEENNLTYVGGELKFSKNEIAEHKLEADKIIVSFELYFQDSEKKWVKSADSSEIAKIFFTPESLKAIEEDGVTFEIT